MTLNLWIYSPLRLLLCNMCQSFWSTKLCQTLFINLLHVEIYKISSRRTYCSFAATFRSEEQQKYTLYVIILYWQCINKSKQTHDLCFYRVCSIMIVLVSTEWHVFQFPMTSLCWSPYKTSPISNIKSCFKITKREYDNVMRYKCECTTGL